MNSPETQGAVGQVLRGLFAANAPGGIGPLNSHNLYDLWKETGFRRDDLASALIALTKSKALKSKYQSASCQYFLDPRWSQSFVAAEASADIVVNAAGRARSQAPNVAFGRRRKDAESVDSSEERRKMQQSRLLKSLSGIEREELAQHIELVPMALGLVLWARGDRLRHFYFPADCVIALSLELKEGALSEVATIGNEGAELDCAGKDSGDSATLSRLGDGSACH